MKYIWSFFALVLILALIYYFAVQKETPKLQTQTVAAEVISSKNSQFKTGDLIFYKQSIGLKEGERVSFEFETGDQVEFNAGSEFQVDKIDLNSAEKIVIFMTAGSFKVLKDTQSKKLISYWRNQFHELSNSNLKSASKLNVQVALPKPTTTNSNESSTPIKLDEENYVNQLNSKKSQSLSNSLIKEVIEKKTPLFQRCHNNALREIGGVSGRMLVSFKVLPRGKTEDIVLLESSIDNKAFQDCIKSVFERSRFRAFNGPPLSVNYPIVFE